MLKPKPLITAAFFAMTFAAPHAFAQGSAATTATQAILELIAVSQKEKRGITFHVSGQTIGGGVTRLIGNEAVEVRNQQYGRIIIRLDRVDAASIN